MSLKSVYLPDLVPEGEGGSQIRLTGEEHHHLSIGRVEEQETLEVFDGRGTVWTADVVSHNRRETIARIVDKRVVPRDADEVILGLSMIRVAAFELAIEKAVEVGVSRIVPVIAARSNTAMGKREGRWLRIIVEAAKQSKRYHLPQLDPPTSFEEMLTMSAPSRIILAERRGRSMKHALGRSPVLYVVGPEGGWTDSELDRAEAAGFSLVGLGSGILRSETAAIVGAGLIRNELQSR
jgi:16S rRNA (uracil1498-N3)-methyltransferase